jgi:hypothetical protein
MVMVIVCVVWLTAFALISIDLLGQGAKVQLERMHAKETTILLSVRSPTQNH